MCQANFVRLTTAQALVPTFSLRYFILLFSTLFTLAILWPNCSRYMRSMLSHTELQSPIHRYSIELHRNPGPSLQLQAYLYTHTPVLRVFASVCILRRTSTSIPSLLCSSPSYRIQFQFNSIALFQNQQ